MNLWILSVGYFNIRKYFMIPKSFAEIRIIRRYISLRSENNAFIIKFWFTSIVYLNATPFLHNLNADSFLKYWDGTEMQNLCRPNTLRMRPELQFGRFYFYFHLRFLRYSCFPQPCWRLWSDICDKSFDGKRMSSSRAFRNE